MACGVFSNGNSDLCVCVCARSEIVYLPFSPLPCCYVLDAETLCMVLSPLTSSHSPREHTNAQIARFCPKSGVVSMATSPKGQTAVRVEFQRGSEKEEEEGAHSWREI